MTNIDPVICCFTVSAVVIRYHMKYCYLLVAVVYSGYLVLTHASVVFGKVSYRHKPVRLCLARACLNASLLVHVLLQKLHNCRVRLTVAAHLDEIRIRLMPSFGNRTNLTLLKCNSETRKSVLIFL